MTRRRGWQYSDVPDDDDEKVSELNSKVKLLKEVSISIGEEVRVQNSYIEKQLNSTADSIWNMLSGNMDQVKALHRAGHNKYIFYLLAFTLFVLIVIYFINKS